MSILFIGDISKYQILLNLLPNNFYVLNKHTLYTINNENQLNTFKNLSTIEFIDNYNFNKINYIFLLDIINKYKIKKIIYIFDDGNLILTKKLSIPIVSIILKPVYSLSLIELITLSNTDLNWTTSYAQYQQIKTLYSLLSIEILPIYLTSKEYKKEDISLPKDSSLSNNISIDNIKILIDLSLPTQKLDILLNILDKTNYFCIFINASQKEKNLVSLFKNRNFYLEKGKRTNYYNLIDIYLSISESNIFGIDILEAQFFYIPVISINNFLNNEIIANGCLLESHQIRMINNKKVKDYLYIDLIEKINFILKRDSNEKYKFGLIGHTYILGNYNFDKCLLVWNNNDLSKKISKPNELNLIYHLGEDKNLEKYASNISWKYLSNQKIENLYQTYIKYKFIFVVGEYTRLSNNCLDLNELMKYAWKDNSFLLMTKDKRGLILDQFFIRNNDFTKLIMKSNIIQLIKELYLQTTIENDYFIIIDNIRLFNSYLTKNYDFLKTFSLGDFMINLDQFKNNQLSLTFLNQKNINISNDLQIINQSHLFLKGEQKLYRQVKNTIIIDNDIYNLPFSYNTLINNNNLDIIIFNQSNNLVYLEDKLEYCYKHNYNLLFHNDISYSEISINLPENCLIYNDEIEIKKILKNSNKNKYNHCDIKKEFISNLDDYDKKTFIIIDKRLKNISNFQMWRYILNK